MTAINFASFEVSELEVLNSADAVALPDLGASSVIIILNTPEDDDVLTEQDLSGSGSLSTSCC